MIGWFFIVRYFLCSSVVFMMVLIPLYCYGDSAIVSIGANKIHQTVMSMKALNEAGVVMQQHEYSCGAASLATVLSYGIGDVVSEREILVQYFEKLSIEEGRKRKESGLSLLDLQNIALLRGHKAQGFRIASGELSKLKRPVIVYIRPRGYGHFAVLKGVFDGRAYLADPSLGNIRMPLYRFLDMWSDENNKGILFVVERRDGFWADTLPLNRSLVKAALPSHVLLRKPLGRERPSIPSQ